MNLANRLKELRLSRHLTQQDLANKLYISRSLYAKYESNISIPSDDILVQLADIYGIPTNDLLGYKTPFNSKRFRFNRIINLVLLSTCATFVIFYFVPFFRVYKYVYPAPIGEQPERVSTLMSSFSLLNENGVWFGNITLAIGAIVICYSTFNIFFLKIAKKYMAIISSLNLFIFIILFFLVITFSCGYTF